MYLVRHMYLIRKLEKNEGKKYEGKVYIEKIQCYNISLWSGVAL